MSIFTKEWSLKKAELEKDVDCEAGVFDKFVNLFFSRYRNYMFSVFVKGKRNVLNYSLEELASKSDIDINELVQIENNLNYKPSMRTIYNLSQVFDVPHISLLRLSGLAETNENTLEKESMRFAARAEKIERLTKEEMRELEEFIGILARG